jgi:hypothetical protein
MLIKPNYDFSGTKWTRRRVAAQLHSSRHLRPPRNRRRTGRAALRSIPVDAIKGRHRGCTEDGAACGDQRALRELPVAMASSRRTRNRASRPRLPLPAAPPAGLSMADVQALIKRERVIATHSTKYELDAPKVRWLEKALDGVDPENLESVRLVLHLGAGTREGNHHGHRDSGRAWRYGSAAQRQGLPCSWRRRRIGSASSPRILLACRPLLALPWTPSTESRRPARCDSKPVTRQAARIKVTKPHRVTTNGDRRRNHALLSPSSSRLSSSTTSSATTSGTTRTRRSSSSPSTSTTARARSRRPAGCRLSAPSPMTARRRHRVQRDRGDRPRRERADDHGRDVLGHRVRPAPRAVGHGARGRDPAHGAGHRGERPSASWTR